MWATGDIIADDDFTFASGLVRIVEAGSQIRESWFVGKVRGRDDTGGLVGSGLGGKVQDSWAVARVEWSGAGDGDIGGLVGYASDNFAFSLDRSWSGGWLDTSADERALAGGSVNIIGKNYFDRSISRLDISVRSPVLAVDTMVTVSGSDAGWDSAAWYFGDINIDLSDGDNAADYPFLQRIEDLWPGLQAVAFADFQTQILSVAGGVELPSEGRTMLGIEESITLTLDTNGLATVAAPTPTCAAGATIAMANYNDVTVRLRTTDDGSAEFTADCKIVIRFADSDSISRDKFSLDVLIASKEATISKWSHSFDLHANLHANRVFLDEIASGKRQWRGVGDADDWDGDGIANAYDWTPTSITIGEVVIDINLTLGLTDKGGTKDNPWPIYNVWQLQAIDGMSVAADGTTKSGLTLFGNSENARLSAQYRLMENIDATPTKEWKNNDGDATIGFNPIGGFFGNDPFTGFLDGGGYAVRGLFINRTSDNAGQLINNVGLFSRISKTGELAVSNLGVEDADIRGKTAVGIIAGDVSDAGLGRVWTTGKVFGSLNVGGLAGSFFGSNNNNAGAITMSWSTANVEGGGNNVGGLIGKNDLQGETLVSLKFDDNWAAGNVSGNEFVGGFSGLATRVDYTRNWSSGAVSGATSVSVGGFGGGGSGNDYTNVYWNMDTSGVTVSDGGSSDDGVVLQVLTSVDFGGEAAAAWAFGGAADFPLLTVHSRPWQAVNLARALTRILVVGDATIVAAAGTTITTTDAIRLDTNGLATDTETSGTSIPNCSFNNTSRVLGAQTNYNGVSVKLSLMTSESGVFIDSTDKNCEVVVKGANDEYDEFAATLRLEISAPAIGGDPARSLTTDYALRIAPVDPLIAMRAARAAFVEKIAAGDFNWFANTVDWDGDGIANPYDWTPTVNADGVTINLTLGLTGEGGTESNPWPIYNVWQLQAIDGVSVSDAGVTLEGLTLFGADASARLGAHYRLALDIDATPTKEWDGGKGFSPIAGTDTGGRAGTTQRSPPFAGGFDGGGYAVRGLFINRVNHEYSGLFAEINSPHEITDLGVEEAEIRGSSDLGILVGVLRSDVRRVWVTGKVVGYGAFVGGLVGLISSANVYDSWSTADVRGAGHVGGLIGICIGGTVTLSDNWAAGDAVVEAVGRNGGFRVGGFGGGVRGCGDVSFVRNWSAGAVSGSPSNSGFWWGVDSYPTDAARVSLSYWNADTSGVTISQGGNVTLSVVLQTLSSVAFGGAAATAWAFGDSVLSDTDGVADFPLLTVHDRPLQAVNLARALTRIMGVGDAATVHLTRRTSTRFLGVSNAVELMAAFAAETTVTTDGIRLDTNGLAADTGTGGTSIPNCFFDEGVLRAQTNYNGVTVKLTLITGGDQNFASAATDNCEVGIANAPNEFAATLRLEISAPATAGYRARTLTTDYALHIAPLPPLVIAAPEAPIMLAADASAGVAVLTVSLSGGKNPSFADADNGALGASGGGEAATITLAAAATAAFASDNLTLSLTLVARAGGGSETETATIRFVSAPRAIERADRFEIALRKRDAGEDAVVFSLSEASIAIWHNGAAAETYTIAQANADFKIAADEALLARALDVGVYAFTLRLTDGTLTASLPTQVSVGEPEKAALARFVSQIEAGEIEWETDIDPYDRTPTVYVDSAFGSVTVVLGGDGTAGNPWQIYNVWQLQAIDGVSVSADGMPSEGLTLFGADERARLGAQYRLAVDIDATPTRKWKDDAGDATVGFNPIGGDFTGFFDGNGYAVRGLFIDQVADFFTGIGGDNIGLFRRIVKAGELAVRNLGVEDADIRGRHTVGIFVGANDANLSKIWVTGIVLGSHDVGGLAGIVRGQNNTIMMSWSTADVIGEEVSGGFIGSNGSFFNDNWAAGNVSCGGSGAGGFSSDPNGSRFTRNWSSGAVSGCIGIGGFAGFGAVGIGGGSGEYFSAYWNLDTSDQTDSAGGEGGAVQTLTVSNFGGTADEAAAWAFGDSILSDGVADFPLLTVLSQPWQAVNLARALTRILGVGDAAAVNLAQRYSAQSLAAGSPAARMAALLATETTITTDGFRLDTNGLAPDERAGGTSTPTCGFDDESGVLRAQTNYNSVTVDLSLLTSKNAAFVAVDMTAENCEVGIENADTGFAANKGFAATLRLEISAPATLTYPARTLTTDYALRITLPPPLMIAAPAAPIMVAAGASAGVAVLTLSVSGGGMNPSFADADNGDLGASGGDDEATITLATAATAAFASDNLTLSVILTASAGDGRKTATATIRFVSAPRVIERADRFEIALRKSNTGENAAVLPLSEASIAIWHNGAAAETYTIAQANADFKIAADEVRAARALDVGVYAFTLRLTDGTLTASLPAQVSVGDPEKAARAQFATQIEAGEVEWWTQINPYDRTPTVYDDPVFGSVTVDLFDGAEGTAAKPWPIYNVWHLQAIESMIVSDENVVSDNFNNVLYGNTDSGRLAGHYYLAVDIDATTTRLWKGGGFRPISSGHSGNFLGSIDGRGNAVRGLFINRSVSVGLIEQLGAGGTIKHLGVEEAEVRGSGGDAGILAALNQGTIERVWTTGKVVGFNNAGGLVGNGETGRTSDSWSTADVEATDGIAGGLFGTKSGGEANDSWAAGDVTGPQRAGGFVGFSENFGVRFRRSWASGAVAGGSDSRVGSRVGFGPFGFLNDNSNYDFVYWNTQTSGVPIAGGNNAGSGVRLQDASAINLGGVNSWDVGGRNDFPLLAKLDMPWQAVNLTRALTHFGPDESAATVTLRKLSIDTNGKVGSGDAPAEPTCSIVDGALRAITGYNNTTVEMRILAPNVTLVASTGCEANVRGTLGEIAATVRLEFSAPATAGYAARRLTVDVLRNFILPESPADARAVFLDEIASGAMRWRDLDPYDWTPTVVMVYGRPVEVNLTLFVAGDSEGAHSGALGSRNNPWPIYNVWQLQAIAGMSVSMDDGSMTGGFALFGAKDARLAAHYRLEADIDATPTRRHGWNGGSGGGFNPIGVDGGVLAQFRGSLDGEGHEIRGLYANLTRDGGLFADIASVGRVSNLGLPDVEIHGNGRNVAAVAQILRGEVLQVWATGEIAADDGLAGGLVRSIRNGGRMRASWFVGSVRSGASAGGLAGYGAEGSVIDSWAVARVERSGTSGGIGGLIGASENMFTLNQSWSGGWLDTGASARALINGSAAVRGMNYFDRSISPSGVAVHSSVIAVDTMVTVTNEDWSAWNFGDISIDLSNGDNAADYPFLQGIEDLRPGRQALAFADFQTRLLRDDNDPISVFAADETDLPNGEQYTLRLDTNGLAADDPAADDPTPTPACSYDADAGSMDAETNYNKVTVFLRTTSGGRVVEVVDATLPGGCVFAVEFADGASEGSAFDLLLTLATKGISTSRAYTFNWTESVGGDSAPARAAGDSAPARFDAEIEARAAFVSQIAAGDFDWLAPDDDWDNDGVLNPYDWTPTSIAIFGGAAIEVNLTLGGADGTADNPWPIYNVWQLQAIDGVSVAADGETSEGLRLFGATGDNLTAHYRLMVDIDAGPASGWDGGAGFAPVGGVFRGRFDGGGNAVRGLPIFRADENDIGLFAQIGENFGGARGAVVNLGIEGANIRGGVFVGALAGRALRNEISVAWVSGDVRGSDNVGGVIGAVSLSASEQTRMAFLWSAANVDGGKNVGGVIGRGDSPGAIVSDSWSAANVVGDSFVGGFLGFDGGLGVAHSWSAGAVDGANVVGGFQSNIRGDSPSALWSIETSGVDAGAGEGVGVDSLQTLAASDALLSDEFWHDGDNNLSDGQADFPLLKEMDLPRQAVNLARALTRVYGGIGVSELLTTGVTTTISQTGEFAARIDSNGEAADNPEHEDVTSTPTCEPNPSADGGGLTITPGYNGVSVRFVAEDADGVSIGTISGCQISIGSTAASSFALVLTFTAGEGDAQRIITRRYPITRSP